MASIRRRKPDSLAAAAEEKVRKDDTLEIEDDDEDNGKDKKGAVLQLGHKLQKNKKGKAPRWSCLDNCCWFIGLVCVIWWLLLFLYNAMPSSFPQYVTEAITGPLPDPPGLKLGKEGLKAKHPVVFVPGIVTGGLELWEGYDCAEGLFRKRLWGGTFGEVYKRYLVYLL